MLVKYDIAAKPVHKLLVIDAPGWVFEDMNNWMCSFFWAGKDRVNGGQCLVSWNTIYRPTCFGGLGVKNLRMQALALQVRWECLRQPDPNSPWQGRALMVDIDARMVFDNMVSITMGRGGELCSGGIDGSTGFQLRILCHCSLHVSIPTSQVAEQCNK